MNDTWYDMGFDADMSWMYDWKGKEKKMTVNEAIDILEEVKELDDSIYQYNIKYLEALNVVIKAAKQQSMLIVTSTNNSGEMIYPQVEGITPTIVRDVPDINVGDLISRQAVLDLPRLKSFNAWGDVIYESVDIEDVKQLPSVNPQPCEDAISREDALMALTGEWTEITDEIIHRFIRRIKALPSVNPQTGHWIKMPLIEAGQTFSHKCSLCGRKILVTDVGLSEFPYCHCGARMEVETNG